MQKFPEQSYLDYLRKTCHVSLSCDVGSGSDLFNSDGRSGSDVEFWSESGSEFFNMIMDPVPTFLFAMSELSPTFRVWPLKEKTILFSKEPIIIISCIFFKTLLYCKKIVFNKKNLWPRTLIFIYVLCALWLIRFFFRDPDRRWTVRTWIRPTPNPKCCLFEREEALAVCFVYREGSPVREVKPLLVKTPPNILWESFVRKFFRKH